jgi:hypothetical protein
MMMIITALARVTVMAPVPVMAVSPVTAQVLAMVVAQAMGRRPRVTAVSPVMAPARATVVAPVTAEVPAMVVPLVTAQVLAMVEPPVTAQVLAMVEPPVTAADNRLPALLRHRRQRAVPTRNVSGSWKSASGVLNRATDTLPGSFPLLGHPGRGAPVTRYGNPTRS